MTNVSPTTVNEMVEVITSYRRELQQKYNSLTGAIKHKKATPTMVHNHAVLEKKLARIDRILQGVKR